MSKTVPCIRCGSEDTPLFSKDGVVTFRVYCKHCDYFVRKSFPNNPPFEVAMPKLYEAWNAANAKKVVMDRLERQRKTMEHSAYIIQQVILEIGSGGSAASAVAKLKKSAVYNRKFPSSHSRLDEVVATIFGGAGII